jgi:hydrophobic/amphiphilic exporter-1 (mainly G- bacteria), HAE1 family
LMTSFAFIAGLVPLVRATGAGAVGNHTIGSSALGGMLFGTVFGVIIVPGLYFVFGKMADGRRMIQGEDLNPLSEEISGSATEESIRERIARLGQLLRSSKSKKPKK